MRYISRLLPGVLPSLAKRAGLTLGALLFLSACSPKFKVGDCVDSERKERWSKSTVGSRILDVGVWHYRMVYFFGEEVPDQFSEIHYVDFTKIKVKCP